MQCYIDQPTEAPITVLCGDCERWFKLAERAAAIAQRLKALEQEEAHAKAIRNPSRST